MKKYKTIVIHRIGDTDNEFFVTRDQIARVPKHHFLTFDDGYLDVYENRDLLIGRDVILFIIGNLIGQDGHMTLNQIMELVDQGCIIGWHTHSHPDLTTLPTVQLIREITPPFLMKYFAYPFGLLNIDVAQAVKDAGYERAYTTWRGDNSQFQLQRKYIKDIKLND